MSSVSAGTHMEIFQDFRDLLMLFNAHGVEYVIVGGYAVAHHGAPRYTGDIEVFVRSSPDNARAILSALNAFGFGSVGLETGDFVRSGHIIQLGYAPCRVDLMTSIDGVSFEEAAAGSIRGTYGDVSVPFIGRPELLRNKRATGRAKDLADIEALEPG